LVDAAQNLMIMGEDCGTKNGININQLGLFSGASIWKKGFGRYLLRDIVVNKKVVAKAGNFLDKKTITELKKLDITEFWVRSSTKCDLLRGVCKTCYGMDLASQEPVELGAAVGIIGAQSLGENGTQLTMNQGKHSHGLILRSDITQGLARVEEVFEARQPKYKAPASPVDGIIESMKGTPENGYEIIVKSIATTHLLAFEDTDTVLKEDKSKIKTDDELLLKSTGELIPSGFIGKLSKIKNFLVVDQKGDEYFVFNTEPGYYPNVKKGEKITRGTLLTEGGADLQHVLDRFGLDLLQDYIITELTSIYAANGIFVDDRHIEIIIKQMCGKVQIIDAGESDQVENDVIRLAVAISINKKLALEGKKTMIFKRVVTGISQASLTTESFLSAASFQNTAQVLVEAVISGRQDNLLGLKENVILGQLIPAGTGFDQTKILNAGVLVEEEFDLELEETLVLE
jgi:DNA-directed RNA polymerase subunit beta'